MIAKRILATSFITLLFLPTLAQQTADELFTPSVASPAYQSGKGPLVFIDEAHGNFHTAAGRFKPFADLLEADGYRVKGYTTRFSSELLDSARILVIANALHSDNQGSWSLPTPSAFTDEEITEVSNWVEQGGSLFLIADHMPFPGAAAQLAARFGVKFYNGFAMRKRQGKDIFTSKNGLKQNLLIQGTKPGEAISSLQSFTGQAFEIPAQATPIIVLNDEYEMLIPQTAWEFDTNTQKLPAENLVQGAYLNFGKGRVVVFGEAAMFTAQVAGNRKVGMNSPDARQNAQFLLNTIHWLDHILN